MSTLYAEDYIIHVAVKEAQRLRGDFIIVEKTPVYSLWSTVLTVGATYASQLYEKSDKHIFILYLLELKVQQSKNAFWSLTFVISCLGIY